MSDKFLNTGGGSTNISNGTANIYGAVLGAVNLNASMPIKTNSTKQLVSEKLDIPDIQNLSSELSLKPELTFTESDTHSTPALGQVKIYAKLDGNMYKKNDQGVESGIGGGGSGSGDVIGPNSSVDNAIAFFDGTTGKLIKENTNFKFITGATYGDQLKVPDIETDDHFSVNEELQKIANFTTATEGATPITSITGELDVEKIKSYTHNVELEFDNNNCILTADGDIDLNAINIRVNGSHIGDKNPRTQNITATPGNTIISGDLQIVNDSVVDTSFILALGSGTNTLAYSTDGGNNWTGLGTTVLSSQANDATYGNGVWVAIGGYTPASIAYSYDGINWTNGPYPFSVGYGVHFGDNLFVALGNTTGGNSILTSTDGVNWTGRGTSIFTAYGTSAYYHDGLWVAGGVGINCLAYSNDGINWTGLGTSLMSNCFKVIYADDKWVAVGSGGSNTILTSVDGVNWTGMGYFNSTNGIAFGDGVWVSATTSGLFYSSDLTTWTSATSTITNAESVVWINDKFLAIGSTGEIQSSPDGVIWAPTSSSGLTGGGGFGIRSTSTPTSLEVGNITVSDTIVGMPYDLVFACTDEVNSITTTGQKMSLRVPRNFQTSDIRVSINTLGGANFATDIKYNGNLVQTVAQGNFLVRTVSNNQYYAGGDIISVEVSNFDAGTATGLKVYLIGKTV